MKDTVKPCHHSVSEDAVYKEVVIIGSGPSGMVTSLLLSGWSPRLTEVPEDLPIDAMLRARLRPHAGRRLLETDLDQLAEGLEGRSHNPIPLLMDNLLNPGADLGVSADPLVEWTYDVDKQIDHVVLGKSPPGGSWHGFDPRILTLSPSGWLALPPDTRVPGLEKGERAPAGRVAEYYSGYVRRWGLQRYFRSGVVVTGVVPRFNRGCDSPACPLAARWVVTGYDAEKRRVLRYSCRYAVLACGADMANTLSALGSGAAMRRVPSPAVFQQCGEEDAVLVVGSGLSAADAVCAARRAGRRVAHAYRTRARALESLPAAVYPDYCEVYKMMREGNSVHRTDYIPLPDHALLEITPLYRDNTAQDESTARKRVRLLDLTTNQITELTVSIVLVLIGSKPDLHFLPPNFEANYDRETCQRCSNRQTPAKRKIERQCFLRDRWHYIKSVVGQGIQSCKSKYWDLVSDSEINGNTDDDCAQPDCKRRLRGSKSDASKDECGICDVEEDNSAGLGLGVDPKAPINCRSNPILIDKSTHEVMNAPEGLYALGPLTSDNFVRFISGGAVAAVAHMRRDRKQELTD